MAKKQNTSALGKLRNSISGLVGGKSKKRKRAGGVEQMARALRTKGADLRRSGASQRSEAAKKAARTRKRNAGQRTTASRKRAKTGAGSR
jgi:hypothetical protein